MTLVVSGDTGVPTGNAVAGGTAGGLLYQGSAGNTQELSTGTAGQVLTSQGTGLPPVWGAPLAATGANLAGGSAGTIPYQSAPSATAMLAAGTTGQVLTGAGAPAPVWTTPTAGTGLKWNVATITSGAATLTSTAYGTMHVINTGVGPIITLPPFHAADAGKVVGLVLGNSTGDGTAIYSGMADPFPLITSTDATIVAHGWTVAAGGSFKMGLYLTLINTGSGWVQLGGSNPMLARGYSNVVQSGNARVVNQYYANFTGRPVFVWVGVKYLRASGSAAEAIAFVNGTPIARFAGSPTIPYTELTMTLPLVVPSGGTYGITFSNLLGALTIVSWHEGA